MSRDTVFHFNIGDMVVCVGDGGGYAAPQMLDRVILELRERNSEGRIGARKAASFDTKRTEIAAIGLEFLELAFRMAPENLWARSETVSSRSQQRSVISLLQDEAREIAKALESGNFSLNKPIASFEKLRRRIHILQRAQHLLESVDDETAGQLDLLLALMERYGTLPFHLTAEPVMPDEPPPDGSKLN